MPRRREVQKRKVLLDPKYKDPLVAKFINGIMRRGKKSLAERIMYGAMIVMEVKLRKEPLEVLRKAVENVKPQVEVKSRRVGGSTYQVPVEVRSDRRLALALRWIIQYAKQRPERTMREQLAAELMEAYNNKGSSVKKREDTHRMAEANKAFAHYRW
jgi:small subunit ribosomal protein S7